MNTFSEEFYLYVILALAVIVMLSFFLPCYGFLRKSWKGLGMGCLLQPVAIILGFLLVLLFSYLYNNYQINQNYKDAMVTVHEAYFENPDSVWHTWYLKPDEECYHEHRFSEVDEDGDTVHRNVANCYDVVRIDSTTVGVEDRIVVCFDLKNHTAIATSLNDTVEIIQIDWPKVEAYLQKQ